jgi:hypothetical protein
VRRRAALAAAAATAAGILLAACGSSGAQQAELACAHVERSITLYNASLHQPDATTASNERRSAQKQLLIAEPLAAAATSSDGSWNGLQTTLIESERVSEGNLMVALESECAGVVTTGTTTPAHNNNTHNTTGPSLPPGA